MNLQEKLFETSAELRQRAQAFANTAFDNARTRADAAAKRFELLKGSLTVLNSAGREFNKVARRNAVRFVKQNSIIAADVRDEVSALARTTFASLTKAPRAKARKASPARKRAKKAA